MVSSSPSDGTKPKNCGITPAIIGILGGTFDPIHSGHMALANAALKKLDMQEIRIIPCYQPVHRQQPFATPEQRLTMVKIAVTEANNERLIVDESEIERKGPSYAIDTLKTLHKKIPNAIFCWLLGSDAFANFTSWKDWQEILKLTHLIIVKRPEAELNNPPLATKTLICHNDLLKSQAGLVFTWDFSALPISSSMVRAKISNKEPVNHLFANGVASYIDKARIYS